MPRHIALMPSECCSLGGCSVNLMTDVVLAVGLCRSVFLLHRPRVTSKIRARQKTILLDEYSASDIRKVFTDVIVINKNPMRSIIATVVDRVSASQAKSALTQFRKHSRKVLGPNTSLRYVNAPKQPTDTPSLQIDTSYRAS